MKFDKRKEVYWIAAIAALTFLIGFLLCENLWDNKPIEIQLHDTYFVFSKARGLVAIFLLLVIVVYGFRGAFGSRFMIVKILAGILAVALLGVMALVIGLIYMTSTQIALARTEQRWEGEFLFSKYPSDVYTIDHDTVEVDSFRVVVIVAVTSDTTFVQTGEVWVQRFVGDSITQKCVGSIDSESNVWIPDQQPLPGMFMIVEHREYGGKINLIGAQGDFIEIPGTQYMVDNEGFLYTGYANDSDTLVYKYHLASRQGVQLANKHYPRYAPQFHRGGGRWLNGRK